MVSCSPNVGFRFWGDLSFGLRRSVSTAQIDTKPPKPNNSNIKKGSCHMALNKSSLSLQLQLQKCCLWFVDHMIHRRVDNKKTNNILSLFLLYALPTVFTTLFLGGEKKDCVQERWSKEKGSCHLTKFYRNFPLFKNS